MLLSLLSQEEKPMIANSSTKKLLQKKQNEQENARALPLLRQQNAVVHAQFPSNISERAVNSGTRIPTETEIVIRHFRVAFRLCVGRQSLGARPFI